MKISKTSYWIPKTHSDSSSCYKAENSALDDPHVSQGCDPCNTHNENKGKQKRFFQSSFLSFKEQVRSLVAPQMASYMDQIYDWKVPNLVVRNG